MRSYGNGGIASAGPSGAVAARLGEAAGRMDIIPLSPEAAGDAEEAGEWIEPEAFPRSFPYTWAMLLARNYEALPLVCPRCGSSKRIIAFITNSSDVIRILEHIGEASEPLLVLPSRAPPEEAFEFNQEPRRDDAVDFDQRIEYEDDTVA